MEKKLRALFDYQRFENNPRLKNMLDDALSRYNSSYDGELSDDEAGLLSAAGSQTAGLKPEKEKRI